MININRSRRFFLKNAIVISAGSALTHHHNGIFAKVLHYSPLAVDPMTVTIAAKTTLDLIGSFSSPKDSGMAAMMRYQNGLLMEIIDQLTGIQTQLVNIQSSILQLSEEFKNSLSNQYRLELLAKIHGAVVRYNNRVLKPSLQNPSILENTNTIEEIRAILNVADDNLTTLKVWEGGIGPEACLVAPLGLSLNLACRTVLKFEKAVLISTLDEYKEWFEFMLSSKEKSIMGRMERALSKHDALINSLENNHLANRLGLQEFKLSGTQIGKSATDPGIMFTTFNNDEIMGFTFDIRGATTRGNELRNASNGTYRRISSIEKMIHPELDAFLINFSRSPAYVSSPKNDGTWDLFKPQPGEYIYMHRVGWQQLANISVVKAFGESGICYSAAEDDMSRAKIENVIANVNLQRAEISLCAQASVVAELSLKRIQEYITILK